MSTNTQMSDLVVAPDSTEERNVREFLRQLGSQTSQGLDPIGIDCRSLQRVTSSHVNTLWQARLLCEDSGVGLVLQNVSDGLLRVLQVLDLSDLFQISVASRTPSVATTTDDRSRSRSLTDLLEPSISEIDLMMSRLVAFLTGAGVPDEVAFVMQTIFYEAATNIRCHAGLRQEDRIKVEAILRPGKISLTLSDPGVDFDPTRGSNHLDIKKAAQEHQRRGFGVAMIRRLSDTVEYRRDQDSTNHLTIEKNW